MKKNKIIIILLIMLSIGIISLYTTFAYQEENIIKKQSDADYNLSYFLKDNSKKEIIVNANEEKFVDINLKNPYPSTIKYGIKLKRNKIPDNVTIALAEDSQEPLQGHIRQKDSKTISIKITNNSEYATNLIIGAVFGFENGNIEDLLTDGEVLIK